VRDFEAEKAANARNLLEYAELGEKMRRMYLRIARRAKIDSEQTSEDLQPENNETPEASAREVREQIESKLGL